MNESIQRIKMNHFGRRRRRELPRRLHDHIRGVYNLVGVFYLACDVRGHGRRRLGVRVGILGDKAGVVGRDAAEPMGSSRGHLQEAAERTARQRMSTT